MYRPSTSHHKATCGFLEVRVVSRDLKEDDEDEKTQGGDW